MKFQKQLIPNHNPAEGRWGDCFRTCIAILLNMDAADVPHFVQISEESKATADKVDCDALARKWLTERGLLMRSCAIHANQSYTNRLFDQLTGNVPYILTCQSPRFKDSNHCVIGHNGPNPIWCPVVGHINAEEKTKLVPWYAEDSKAYYRTVDVIVRPLEA